MDTMTIILIITSVISVASFITSLLPTPAPDSRWAAVYRAIEFLARVNDVAKQRPELTAAAQDLAQKLGNVRGTGLRPAIEAARRVVDLAR